MKTIVFSPKNSNVGSAVLRQAADSVQAQILSLPLIALTILLMAWTSSGQIVVFSDNFTSDANFTNVSTLNSTTPGFPVINNTNNFNPNADWTNSVNETNFLGDTNFFADTSYTTTYEIISSQVLIAHSLSSSNLDFGLAPSSSSQSIQVQALFADDTSGGSVLLGATNDYIQLTVTFTDKKGILTNSAGGGGYFYMGLFNAASVFSEDTNGNSTCVSSNPPVAGGLTNAVSTSSTHATGNAQNWVGYSDQIANTGHSCRINTRVGQTGTGNNNQDVLCGSDLWGTIGYGNPGPNISHSSSNSTVVLTNGSQYTAVLTLTTTAVWPNDGTTNENGISGGYACAISNTISLYAGVGTSGPLLAQYGINMAGTNYTTNEFDAFAIGWLESDHNVASEISISQITVTAGRQSDIADVSIGGSVVVQVDSNSVPLLGASNAVIIVEPDDNVVVEDITDATGTNGVETVVAGNGTAGYSGDGGLATNACLNSPSGVYMDRWGDLYIADTGNNVIRMVWTNGCIYTMAGNGTAGYSGDGGAATGAELNAPYGVGVDNYWADFYIADTGNNVIRKVNHATGIISTVAGNGTNDYSGDGGPATNACLNAPAGVNMDDDFNLMICDTGNNVMRSVDTNGIISTVEESTNSLYHVP